MAEAITQLSNWLCWLVFSTFHFVYKLNDWSRWSDQVKREPALRLSTSPVTLLNRVHVALWNRPLVLLPKAAQTHNNTQTATKRRLDLQNKHPERKSSSKDESIISGGLLILLNYCSNIMVKNLSQLWFQLSLQSDIFLMDTRLWLLSVADGRAAASDCIILEDGVLFILTHPLNSRLP